MSQSSFSGFPRPRPDKGGTNTGDANAQPQDILTGYSGYVKGVKVNGTMPNNGAVTITPSTSNQTIAQGYHNGSGYVKGDPNLVSPNIKQNVSLFGVTGSLPTYATGACSWAVNGTNSQLVVGGLSFQPSKVVIVGTTGGQAVSYDASVSSYIVEGTTNNTATVTFNSSGFTFNAADNNHLTNYSSPTNYYAFP